MSDSREVILAKREGYKEGIRDQEAMHRASLSCHVYGPLHAERRAAEKYPLTVSVQRIVDAKDTDGAPLQFSMQFEGISNVRTLAWRRPNEDMRWGFDTITRFQFVAQNIPELFRVWADILEHPLEERPAEDKPVVLGGVCDRPCPKTEVCIEYGCIRSRQREIL